MPSMGVFEPDGGRPKNVTSIVEGRGYAGSDLDRVSVARAAKLPCHPPHLVSIVERSNTLPAPAAFLLVDIGAIVFLNAGRVFQHDRREVTGSGGDVDLAGEPLFGQDREGAGMVDVGVGQQHGADRLRVESQATILVLGLLAGPLEHSAIHQDVATWNFGEMATPGDRTCGTVK